MTDDEKIKNYRPIPEKYWGVKYFKMRDGKVEPLFWQDLCLYQQLLKQTLEEVPNPKHITQPKTMETLDLETSADRLGYYLTVGNARKIFEANRAKGFWGENPNDRDLTEVTALVISELFEAFEALRKKNFADGQYVWDLYFAMHTEKFDAKGFQEFVKDTFEDEIADAMIRALDLIGYLGYRISAEAHPDYKETDPIKGVEIKFFNNATLGGESPASEYSVWLLRTAGKADEVRVTKEYYRLAVGVLNGCIAVATAFGFFHTLRKHIELKLAFNATRPFKHGKSF